MSDLSTDVKNAALSNWVKDAYKKDCLSMISIHFFPKYGATWIAKIEFENGNTTGKQEIKNANLEALMYEMKMFLDTLK